MSVLGLTWLFKYICKDYSKPRPYYSNGRKISSFNQKG